MSHLKNYHQVKARLRKQSEEAGQKPKRVDCRGCAHYYITWDQNFPYGCAAMKFKAPITPCLFVFQSSGMPCQMFEPKKKDAG